MVDLARLPWCCPQCRKTYSNTLDHYKSREKGEGILEVGDVLLVPHIEPSE